MINLKNRISKLFFILLIILLFISFISCVQFPTATGTQIPLTDKLPLNSPKGYAEFYFYVDPPTLWYWPMGYGAYYPISHQNKYGKPMETIRPEYSDFIRGGRTFIFIGKDLKLKKFLNMEYYPKNVLREELIASTIGTDMNLKDFGMCGRKIALVPGEYTFYIAVKPGIAQKDEFEWETAESEKLSVNINEGMITPVWIEAKYLGDYKKAPTKLPYSLKVDIGPQIPAGSDANAIKNLQMELNNSNWVFRRQVIRRLGEIKDERVKDYLLTALQDEISDVRIQAAIALADYNDPKINEALIPVLIKTLDLSEKNMMIKEIAIILLRQIGSSRAIEPIKNLLKEVEQDQFIQDKYGENYFKIIFRPLAEGVMNDLQNKK